MASASATPGVALVDELEKAFQDCVATLTNPDLHNGRDSDDLRTSVDLTTQHFLEVAKQLDCFFVQKRLLLSVQKPEHLLLENIQELTNEVNRKDAVIEKYNNKIPVWQSLLQEASSHAHLPRPPPPPNMAGPPQPPPGMSPHSGHSSQSPMPQMSGHSSPAMSHGPSSHSPGMPPMSGPSVQSPGMMASQSPGMPPMGGPPQGPGMPPHPHPMMPYPHGMNPMTSSPVPMQPGMGMPSQQMHPQQGHPMGPQQGGGQPGGLQGPLAFLERTMSSIGHM